MSKMLPASCVGGIVTSEGFPVPAAEILSEGVGQSEGILLIDEDEARYLAKTTPDLKTTLEQTIAALDQLSSAMTTVASALTSIGAMMTGPTTAPPPTLPTDVASITAAVVQATAAKVQLQALKEVLK